MIRFLMSSGQILVATPADWFSNVSPDPKLIRKEL